MKKRALGFPGRMQLALQMLWLKGLYAGQFALNGLDHSQMKKGKVANEEEECYLAKGRLVGGDVPLLAALSLSHICTCMHVAAHVKTLLSDWREHGSSSVSLIR